jgi:hypothetical protein
LLSGRGGDIPSWRSERGGLCVDCRYSKNHTSVKSTLVTSSGEGNSIDDGGILFGTPSFLMAAFFVGRFSLTSATPVQEFCVGERGKAKTCGVDAQPEKAGAPIPNTTRKNESGT